MEKYDSYKDSGIEWIGEIPTGWNINKLKYISEVIPSNVDKHIYPDEIQVQLCNYTDVYYNESITSKTELKRGSCNETEYNKYLLKKGDVIITKDSESPDDIGIPTIVSEDLNNVVCGYHLTLIRPIKCEDGFIFRFIQSDRTQKYFEVNSNGITRFGLGKSSIENLVLPFPSTSEQKRIVQFLDTKTTLIDSLIEKTQRKIILLKEKRTSLINHVVTKGLNPYVDMKNTEEDWIGVIPNHWGFVKLKQLFNIQKRISGELGFDVLSVTQKGLKVKDLENNQGQHSMDYSKYQFVYEGDFVMNHMDLLTGYVDLSIQTGVTSPDYRVFTRKKEDIENKFYLYIFQLCYLRKIFYGLGRGVSNLGRWRLPSIEFLNFRIPYPSFEEQQQIVDYLDKETKTIDITISKEERRIELLKEYRQSLISEVVTGKIKVTTDE